MRPTEAVRLALERSRLDGAEFDDAWAAALKGIWRCEAHAEQRRDFRAALGETVEAWRRAYAGEEPLPGETAAAFLLDALDGRDALDEPLGVRVGMVLG